MIITQFAHYIEEMYNFHAFLEYNCIVVEIIQRWMKIGPSFPSTFGSNYIWRQINVVFLMAWDARKGELIV